MITITAEAKKSIERQAFKIRRGRIVFVKNGQQWIVAGPVKPLVAGATVEVTKADGSASNVVVAEVTDSVPVSIICAVATFTNAPAAPVAAKPAPVATQYATARRTYRTCPDCGQRWTADHEEFCPNFTGGF